MVANGKLYFKATDGLAGDELWVSDGTRAGTVLAADINPGAGGSALSKLTQVDNELYFVATAQGTGEELWKLSLNTPPTQVLLSNTSIGANQPIGTLVGNLSTNDRDSGDSFFTRSFLGLGQTTIASFILSTRK